MNDLSHVSTTSEDRTRELSCRGGDARCAERAPAKTQGGCALRGAKLALQPITDAVHVVHGTQSCLGHVWSSRPTESSASHLHRYSVTTALGEVELILGGSERLQRVLDRVANELKPKAIFVYESCLTAMIGEDLRAECRAASLRLSLPVHAVEASGLAGGKQKGHELAVKLLCEQVVGSIEPAIVREASINLVGEFNVRGEVAELRDILDIFGITILASIPGDGCYEQIASAHRAKISLDLCSQAMPDFATHLRRAYKIPVVQGSLYGSKAFVETLQNLVQSLMDLGLDSSIRQRAEQWIDCEQRGFRDELYRFSARLAGKRVLVYLGGVKTWSLIEDLQAAGMIVCGVSLHKCSDRDKERNSSIKRECRQKGLPVWQDTELETLLRSGGIDVVLSGGGIKYLAHKHAIPCIDMSHERQFSLLGFNGIRHLLAEIARITSAPVWRLSSTCVDSVLDVMPRGGPPEIILPTEQGRVNPFAFSQPMGAVLALQGISQCLPLLFGAQGCSSSSMIFLNRYFSEQITLHSVSLNDIDTVYGGGSALGNAIDLLAKKHPEIIAVISTGTTEAQGAGQHVLPKIAEEADHTRPKLLYIQASDLEGTLQDGWGKAVHAVVADIVSLRTSVQVARRDLLLLPGSHISVADLEWLRETVEAFGMRPVILPDISTALDGRHGDPLHAAPHGGSSHEERKRLLHCSSYIGFGEQMRDACDELAKSGIAGTILTSISGLRVTDHLLQRLADISGRTIPDRYRVQRMQLMDAMIDQTRCLTSMRVMIAAEPDLLADMVAWMQELGVESIQAMSPVYTPLLKSLALNKVMVGDYQILERHLEDCNVLIAPDSAELLANKIGVAHYPVGIHEQRSVGAQFHARMGYRAARDQIFALVNLHQRRQTR